MLMCARVCVCRDVKASGGFIFSSVYRSCSSAPRVHVHPAASLAASLAFSNGVAEVVTVLAVTATLKTTIGALEGGGRGRWSVGAANCGRKRPAQGRP